MIDTQARQKLFDKGRDNALTQGLSQIGQSISQSANQKDPTPLIEFVIKQLQELNASLESGAFQKIKGISDSLTKSQLTAEQYGKLQELVKTVNDKMAVFDSIKEKIDSGQTILFPKETKLSGKVDVGTIESLPAIEVKNFPVPQKLPAIMPVTGSVSINSLPPVNVSNLSEIASRIESLQITSLQTIKSLQTKFPDSFNISNEVKIADFSELLDSINETNKGINMLLNKEGQSIKGPMQVEIVKEPARMTPQPVTKIDINPLRGAVVSTGVTVGTSPALLPPTALDKRRSIIIFNNHATTTMYIGGSGVTNSGSAIGLPIIAQSYSPVIDAGPQMAIYGIAASGSLTAIVLEAGNDYGTLSTSLGNI